MKIAVIATTWFPLSHADVIVSRWLDPFPGDVERGWEPKGRIVSLFLEQQGTRDIGAEVCAADGIPILDTVEAALTLGGENLAVDAVLLIGEHGDYPRNEYGQKLYPRRRLFDEIVAVFRGTGRAVPVFNDKHFSWDFGDACEMLQVARELGFPVFGGSSLPHCPIFPAPPVRAGEQVVEAVSLFHGDPDSYGFHSMELLQSCVERRAGEETGIDAVRAWSGEAAREAIVNEVPRDLFSAALAMHGYPPGARSADLVLARVEDPWLFQLEYGDGLRAFHLLLPKFASSWVVTVRAAGEIRAARLDDEGGPAGFFANFAHLNTRVQEFFLSGRPPTPCLRTHLAGGALQACLQAAKFPGRWKETPHLKIAYSHDNC